MHSGPPVVTMGRLGAVGADGAVNAVHAVHAEGHAVDTVGVTSAAALVVTPVAVHDAAVTDGDSVVTCVTTAEAAGNGWLVDFTE